MAIEPRIDSDNMYLGSKAVLEYDIPNIVGLGDWPARDPDPVIFCVNGTVDSGFENDPKEASLAAFDGCCAKEVLGDLNKSGFTVSPTFAGL